MRFKYIFLCLLLPLFGIHCSSDKNQSSNQTESSWVSPEAGTSVNLGDEVTLQVKLEKAWSAVFRRQRIAVFA